MAKRPGIANLMSARIVENPDGTLIATVKPCIVVCTIKPIALTRGGKLLHYDDVIWQKPENLEQTALLARHRGWALGAVCVALREYLSTANLTVTEP